ncbi:extracellular solute-binding protein family 1 [Thermobaculum terrenum ATCC BAA-798]|uniref:Extracellular solute-binding protein family 1 n=1 Tax=Thermobaculum terrenum (strain ATCC BAA-798 / CCMEE 7001 / YNP1) TaxID=525904 RepID=D1CGJ8_THET1|nr:substrate-binding domain-containing protein [Thermobaculum terrenum]ACZ42869.1 extracellular solute-binding protein family 1 [Thermobaculum terrenum ATCC BAA-798]
MSSTEQPLSRRSFLKIGGLALAGMAVACGAPQATAPTPKSGGASSAPVKITFWNALYPTEDPNKKKKREQFYIYQAIKRFESANPHITVELVSVPGDPQMFTKFRTASIAKNGPDVFGTWSGNYMLNLKQFLEPLDSYFTQPEKDRITGWEAVTEGFRPGQGKTYGVPAGSDGCVCIFYNKDLLSKAGVDPEKNWPSDFAGFLQVLQQIKTTGVIPLTLGGGGYVYHLLNYWIAQMIDGSPGLEELVTGKRKFSDPKLVSIVQNWTKLRPYTNPGAESAGDEAVQLFYRKKAAMTTGGFWIISDARTTLGDALGMVKIPNYSDDAPIKNGGVGGVGTAFVVSNYSKHKQEAVDFIKFLMSKEEQELKAKSGEGNLVNVKDVDPNELYKDPLLRLQYKWGNEPTTIFWPDNVFPAELTAEEVAQAQLAWTGKLSPKDFMEKLDNKRDELL